MPIKYDDFLKRPGQEFEYSLSHVEELDRCMNDITYYLKYVKIIHPDHGRIKFQPREFQTTILETIKNNNQVCCLISRQSGKTTIISIYALWFAIFNPDKFIGIVSNKQSSAVDILGRIKTMYEELPLWLKPGVVEWSKLSVKFDNGTQIVVSATSADAFRGRTLNLLFCDEIAFVRKGIAEDFWAANFPTMSASEEAKIVIISTPNGPFNLFHRLYTQAERGENTFIPLKYNWKCVPERDEKWATDQRKNLGKLKFEQEHEVDFIGSINTIVDKDVLEKLYFGVKEPITREMTGKLLIYEKPIEGSRYVIGADTAKGTGEHHSALQVCKIISTSPAEFQQVATFFDNRINVFKFADLINKLSIYYNDAFMMVENNAEGSAVVNRLWWDYENEGLVNTGSKESQLGIRATKNTRPRAVTLMKKLVEDEKVHIVDKETVDELTSFIEENGKFKGKDMPDDIISALYWCLFIVEMDVFEEKATLTRDTHDAEEWEEVWGIITDGDSENNFDWLISESKLID